MIGVLFAEEEKYHIAIVWLLEAFRKFNKTDRIDDLEANILNSLVYAYKMLSNYCLFMECNEHSTVPTTDDIPTLNLIQTFR